MADPIAQLTAALADHYRIEREVGPQDSSNLVRTVPMRFPLGMLAGLLVVSGHAPALSAQSRNAPTFEELLSLQRVGGVALSPDGRQVAYTVTSTEWKDNRYDTEIWLARPGTTPIQLTRTAKGSSTSPQWSPDGKWLGFLADRGDKQQLYVLALLGGEAVAVTVVESGVQNFEWSPDGKWIGYTAATTPSKEMKDRKEKYGDFAPEDEDWNQVELWLTAADPTAWGTGKPPEPTRLTEGSNYTVSSFSWSPDGTRIAIGHQRDPLINSWSSSDISIVVVADRTIRPLVTAPGPDQNPIWSPDGQWLLYSSSGGDTTSNYYRNGQLMRVAASGGAATPIVASFDEQIGGLSWTPSGIYFVAWQKTDRQLFRIDPASWAVQPVSSKALRIGGVSFSADGRTVAFTGTTSSTATEAFLSPVEAWAPKALTTMSDQLAAWSMPTSEVVSWKSRDGTTIEGVLYRPADFDPTRKYPLLVVIHGGPTGIDAPQPPVGGVYPIWQWVAKGALVLRPNYRGSAGYGEAFRRLNVKNLGVGDMWDVMSGVDYLVGRGMVDTARMGSMGWSQGGYISAFLTTNTDRFKAISVGAGISNWVTYYVATDIHPFTRQYLEATPWDDPDIYRKTSGMTNIRNAKTPTLIQHGEFDRRVPIQNAYELYQGLQDVGVPTRLVVYQGFGHGINKPKEALAATTHNWEWFDRYLWGPHGPVTPEP